ncbi:NAD-dependent epimerase/dehydratase family protein [Shewanella glacialipiscicola]|uniref:Epimerase n=1 Tax=Shewanella glacialipiscicola TaxID=614069 RepID=A0ABQ6J117_9GAMM|nr:NAD-dependent epimerase/dehydratase family protein [Shewanella glacialipiscicola]MCL1085199.1 NAD-dependent epimerase/dehydratase family protein [Shewanella glacialipiscicola]GIU14809.1 epimerase [Shewanella glacialipiscicola]GMA81404.1 epimerase [Shewanella glacialipiscicola]
MILLTGSSGFVGSEILNQLTQRAVLPIRTYGRRDSGRLKISQNMTVDHAVGDIGPEVNYANALRGVDVIIHCAALAHMAKSDELSYQNINTLGTIELAKQAQQASAKRFVYISSIGVNGPSTKNIPFSVDSTVHPHNAYAKSKYDAEIGLKKIAAETGLEVVIVRPTLVYGAHAPGNFGSLIKLVKRIPVLPFGLADNKRDFISVKNLADLLITCALHPKAPGHTFLASDGETVSIKDFTNAIAKGLDKKLIQLPIPVSLMRLVARLVRKSAMAEQLLGNLQVDSSNAQEVLGWIPPYTMEQAMASLSENKK